MDAVLSPPFVLSLLLSTAYGAGFHLVFGGNRARLLLYLLTGWLGFALGHLVGGALGITALDIGAVHTLPATLGSWVALITARWLSNREW